jgi:hypothetical protein
MKVNLENVKANPEKFGEVLYRVLGWDLNATPVGSSYPKSELLYRNLDLIHEVELAVIEKVGIEKYGAVFFAFMFNPHLLNYSINQSRVDKYIAMGLERVGWLATADASTKLCVCLLALGIEEIED